MFPLSTTTFLRPREKMLESPALTPEKAEETGWPEGVHISAKKSFQPPANVRAGPRTQPVAFGGSPVVAKCGEEHSLLPTFASAERSDVRDMVAAMPGVVANHIVEGHRSHFWMTQASRKVLGRQRAQQDVPAMVKGFQQRERNFDGSIARVLQLGPESLVVGLDRRLIFGERKFASDVRIHMAVGNVVHDLPDGPAAWAIGRIKLPLGEPGNSVSQSLGRRGNLRDRTFAFIGGQRLFVLVLPDWVTQIHWTKPSVKSKIAFSNLKCEI
jgi:hypothetical protein